MAGLLVKNPKPERVCFLNTNEGVRPTPKGIRETTGGKPKGENGGGEKLNKLILNLPPVVDF